MYLMIIHKTKRKEFDEVVIYEGTLPGRIKMALCPVILKLTDPRFRRRPLVRFSVRTGHSFKRRWPTASADNLPLKRHLKPQTSKLQYHFPKVNTASLFEFASSCRISYLCAQKTCFVLKKQKNQPISLGCSPNPVNDLREPIGTSKAQVRHIPLIVKIHPQGHEFLKISQKNPLSKLENSRPSG